MKLILLLAFTALMLCLSAQDSTEVKLQKYKGLYEKGLIDSAEYKAMRGSVLGNLPAPIFITPKIETLAEQTERYERHGRAGTGLIVTGGLLLISGAGCLGAVNSTIPKRNTMAYRNGTYSTSEATNLTIAGVTLLAASVPFIVTGPIEISRYRRFLKRTKQNVNITAGIGSFKLNF